MKDTIALGLVEKAACQTLSNDFEISKSTTQALPFLSKARHTNSVMSKFMSKIQIMSKYNWPKIIPVLYFSFYVFLCNFRKAKMN